MVRARPAIASMTIVLAAILPGCIGGPDSGPGPGAYRMEFEGGTGYGNIFTYVNTTGPFPVRAVIDADWRIAYAGYSDGVIHWWNFTDPNATTTRIWPASEWTCVRRGLELLPNHSLATACGARVSLVAPDGSLEAAVTFSGNLSHFALALGSGLVVAAIESPAFVEIRNISDGQLTASFGLSRTTRQVASDASGRFIGTVEGDVVKFYDVGAGTNQSFEFWGSMFISATGTRAWVYQRTANDTYPNDALIALGSPLSDQPIASIPLANHSTFRAESTEFDIQGTTDGSSVAQYSVAHEYTFSHGQFQPSTNNRNLILVYNTTGFVRGMAVPGEALRAELMANGSIYVVSTLRAVLGGSQLWLSYAEPDCSPPVLVRHNITA